MIGIALFKLTVCLELRDYGVMEGNPTLSPETVQSLIELRN